MPELPEVETIKRDLKKATLGLYIEEIFVYDLRVIKELSEKEFIRRLKGRRILKIERRAKALIIFFDQGLHLVVQLKMTGQLIIHAEQLLPPSPDTKVTFRLSNNTYLNYNDQRTFGWLIVTEDLREVPYLHTAGPEPLNEVFNFHWLKKGLRGRKAPIKNLLMNQNFLAGIGNIYASEILFSAHINPRKKANRLTHKEILSLQKSTQEVLENAVKHRGTSMRNYRDSRGHKGNFMSHIKVYGREDEQCLICSETIKRIVQSGRSTFFCRRCQS